MGQVAMRAPQRGMRGATVEGVRYEVSEQGVVMAHDVHVKGFRSLGFKRCTEENPDVPEVASISEEDWAAFSAFRQAKADKQASASSASSASSTPAPAKTAAAK